MFFLIAFSLLFWSITARSLLPLNVLFISDTNDGFTFIQDPTAADSLVLQVSYHDAVPPGTKPLYFCEALSVKKQRKNDHILIDSVPYKVLHRDEHLLLTSVDWSVIKLRASNSSRDCMESMVLTSTILAPHHSDVVVPVGHKDQLAAWSKVGLNVTYFSAFTGAVTALATVSPSSLAKAACPSCTILSAYEDEQYWFVTPGRTTGAQTKLVNQKGESFAPDWATQSGTVYSISVSKKYFFVHSDDELGLLCVYKKNDFSVVYHQLRLPRMKHLQCDNAFLSPDETRVLAYCSFHYKPLLHEKYVYQWLLVEMSVDNGVVVNVHSLSGTQADDWSADRHYGGSRFGSHAVLARIGNDKVHIYKYTV